MDQEISNVLGHWGPALLVCPTVVIGLFYQNSRLNDMKSIFDRRLEDLNRRFEDAKLATDRRFDDLKDYLQSEFKRLEDRIDRLESPLSRR